MSLLRSWNIGSGLRRQEGGRGGGVAAAGGVTVIVYEKNINMYVYIVY